jgi:hypothetical protein
LHFLSALGILSGMKITKSNCLAAAVSVVLLLCFLPSIRADVAIHLPDYSATTYAVLPYEVDSIALDNHGDLYVTTQFTTEKFDANANPYYWSSTIGFSLVFAPDDNGYVAGGDTIFRISPDGTPDILNTVAPNQTWNRIALGAASTLYGNINDGKHGGLFSINTITGEATQLAIGGPAGNGT